jgi:hypothetical protein
MGLWLYITYKDNGGYAAILILFSGVAAKSPIGA